MGIRAVGLFSHRNPYSEASTEFKTHVLHIGYCPTAGRKAAVEISGVLMEFNSGGQVVVFRSMCPASDIGRY